MAFDFPSPATDGQEYAPAGGPVYVYQTPVWKVKTAPVAAAYDVGRNLIHNSLFTIAQRGGGVFNTNGGYTADRWKLIFNIDTVNVNHTTISNTPRAQIGDEAASYALSVTPTGSSNTEAYTAVYQPIEGVRRIAGKTVTISFYAWTSAARNIGVSIDQTFGTGGGASAAVNGTGTSVAITATAARYSVTLAVPSISSKIVGSSGTDCSTLNLWFSSGATNAARAGNVGVQTGTTFYLWGVQVEVGTTATPLEKPDPETQLRQCQRFYQKGSFALAGMGAASGGMAFTMLLPVPMRGGTPAYTTTPTSQINCSGLTASADANSPLTTVYVTATATASSAFAYGGTFTASADL